MYSHRQSESRISQLNWLMILLVLLMGGLGIAMLHSAAGSAWDPWASRHAVRFAAGFVAMIIIALLPSRLLLRFAYLFYFACLGLLVVVELFGQVGMGAQRWISLGFINLQPSELMKLGLILALARYYHGMLAEDVSRFSMMLLPLALIAMPVVLILLQPNLGTAFITASVGTVLLFITGIRIRYFVAVAILVVCSVPVAWHFLHDYQKQRVMTFLNPEEDPLGTGYNIIQSKIAIGSGGVFGRGLGEGTQSQLNFLPEKHTDFIFTMIAEELGFVGAMTTIGLFTLLIFLCIATAIRSRSHFGAMISTGIAALLLLHVGINIGMVMGLLPVVGVPLPLLSYGGTMLLTTLFGLGLVLNCYVHRDEPLERRSLL